MTQAEKPSTTRRAAIGYAIGGAALALGPASGLAETRSADDLAWRALEDQAAAWRVAGAIAAVKRARAAGLRAQDCSGMYREQGRGSFVIVFGDWDLPGSRIYHVSAVGVVAGRAL